MKYYSLGLLFILISCSSNKKNELHEKAEPVAQEIESYVPATWEKFDLKIRIDAYFESAEDLVVENEFGGGDCWHTVKEYKTSIQNARVVNDDLDCGDYGFTRYRLVQSAMGKPLILEIKSKEWMMTEAIPYIMKEWIIDFNDTTKIYFRKYISNTFDEIEIPDSVRFSLSVDDAPKIFETIYSIYENRNFKMNETEWDKYESEIKQIAGITDPIEILKVKYFEFDSAYIFIDQNLKSKYNTGLGVDFQSYSVEQKELYESSYNHWFDKLSGKPMNNNLLEGLRGDWIPIDKYRGKYFLYVSFCDHMLEGYTISDTTVINYYMDGPSPDVIDNVIKDENAIVINTVNGAKYRFQQTRLDDKVFIMQNGRSKMRLVKETNRTAFPCIVKLCHELGTSLNVGFEPINDDE